MGKSGPRCLCGTDIGLGGDSHADVACQCGEHGTDDKRNHDEPVRGRHQHGHHPEQGSSNHNENGEDAVFSTEEGEGTFVDVLGDGTHLLLTGAL